MKNREGFYVGETDRECTKCGKIFPKTSKTVTLCNFCNSERVKSMGPEKRMLARAKGRAKEFGLEFDITADDIIIPEYCPILGMKLEIHKGKSGGRKNSASLDRIDPTKGYTKDNIMVISHLANGMKLNANKEELITFATWILNNQDLLV